MKLSFILLAACIINCNNCFSQMQWPPAYEIKSDTAMWQDITTGCWMILEDKHGKWKLDDVLTMHESGKFHSIGKGFDTTVQTYWIVYRLHNMMNSDARISLNSMSDFDEFYVKSDSAPWKHFVSGKLNDWEKKDGLKIADCIPVVMQPGESYTVYQRVSNTKPGLPDNFQVVIVNTDKIIQEYYINDAERRDRYFY
ncbi:MAG: 7TMR-DISMED2 domain-containing protein, partial [Chitinophagaceae bacterium]